MINIILWILVIVLVFGVASYIIRQMEIDPPMKNIALLLVGIICLVALLYLLLGVLPWPGRVVP